MPFSLPRLRTANLLVVILAAFVSAFVVAACVPTERKSVTLRFWHGFTGKDGEVMLELVRRFKRENPDVDVTVQRMPWGTYYNKLFVAGLAGRAPEVFVCHSGAITRLRRAEFIRPIDELAAGESSLPLADIDATALAAVRAEGRHYGVPLDVHPIGLLYNRTLLREAKLVDATGEAAPPPDWDGFVDAVRRLKRDTDHDGRMDEWGFAFEGSSYNILTSWMWQFGGDLLNEQRDRPTLVSPENIAALNLARRLVVDERLVPRPEEETSWASFLQGKVGMFFGGVFMLRSLETQTTIDYAAAPLPQFGPKPAVWAESHVMCLPQGLDEKKTEAAWRFITFLSNHSVEWARGGQIPVRASLRATPGFQALTIPRIYAQQLNHVRYSPAVPYIFELQRELRIAFEQILRGAATPEEALAKAQRNIEAVIARDRVVEEKLAERARKAAAKGGGSS
jgi:multiple sugar transport system substrate-binding protein